MQDTEPFTRVICWNPSRIREVINKEAVSVNRADFLATHAPLNRIKYLRAPQAISDTSEERLLDELWDRTETDTHTFMVVQGIPGTGKSHLIRWLKERYVDTQNKHGSSDVVLLIERANNSLRGTLQQLINSNAFDEQTMREQLEKLRGAADKLSRGALADSILNNLQVATQEVTLREEDTPRPRIRNNVEKFLLDYNIREALKEPEGPVDRLVRFLSDGTVGGIRADEQPGFEANDFTFDVDTLQRVRERGYQEAQTLADSLALKQEVREELARYLNQLLRFAIGQAMALSAEDLKQMFFDLRRELRAQERSLVLFIEDITAFTGIDAGLIDVLATQHTGEDNRAFCRLISVIGITDGYFANHFPDNMKDRITHQLTLNAVEQGRQVSDTLQDPDVVIDVAARYLNAMRLDRQQLAEWAKDGSQADRLPNACATCRFREPCHAAFDAKALENQTADVNGSDVGLYPFNRQALVTMYQHLDPVVSRTPRSLLNSVLEYVLQSHGQKVKEGRFPPAPHLVGSEFRAPDLSKPVQRQAIDNQAGPEAARVRSLILFWGDRTIDASPGVAGRLVGGLSEGVFKAFDAPFIAGVTSGSKPTDGPGPQVGRSPHEPPVQTGAGGEPVPPPVPPWTTPRKSDRQRDLAQSISKWSAGEQLRDHEALRGYLESFIQSAIDWEAHGIGVFQWKERCITRRMCIGDQAGKMNVNDYITFERSPELAYVLQALVDLNDGSAIEPATLSTHLATLSRWLSQQEAQIVAFVRSPRVDLPAPRPLVEVLLIDCLLLDWLSGSLRTRDTAEEMLKDIIRQCAVAVKDNDRAAVDWSHETDRAKKTRSQLWTQLMSRFGQKQAGRAITCHTSLLQLLNRAQGGSQNVRFIDAATALDSLHAFDANGWTLAPMAPGDFSSTPAWLYGTEVYQAFQAHVTQLLADEQASIRRLLMQFNQLLGGASVEQSVEAMTRTLAKFKQYNLYFDLPENPPYPPATIDLHRASLVDAIKQGEPRTTAFKLSAAETAIEALQNFTAYLETFQKLAGRRLEKAIERIAQLEAEGVRVDIQETTERAFAEIERKLDAVIAPVTVQEGPR